MGPQSRLGRPYTFTAARWSPTNGPAHHGSKRPEPSFLEKNSRNSMQPFFSSLATTAFHAAPREHDLRTKSTDLNTLLDFISSVTYVLSLNGRVGGPRKLPPGRIADRRLTV